MRIAALVLWLTPAIAGAAGTPTGDTGTTPTTPTAHTGTTVGPTGDTSAVPTGDTGPSDTGLDLDMDGDGWTPREGDCDDSEPLAAPQRAEVCEDRIDNDCNGLYDEECDYRTRIASLQGGGGCTGGAAPGEAWLMLPLLGLGWLGRRARR